MILMCLLSFVVVQATASDKLGPLLSAIRAVETSGVTEAHHAVGGRGRRYSEAVILAFWKRHCPEALRKSDIEVLARVQNGGPNGQKNRATETYSGKVNRYLMKATHSVEPGRAGSGGSRRE